MSEQTYKKVFEVIQESLVPKTQLEESQNKILQLETMLEKATRELEKVKSEYNGQKLTIEIIQAEKDSLQAEKRAIELKFNEVSLKLKKKTKENDLLSTKSNTAKSSVLNGTKKIKVEPSEIGIVNVPASSSSRENDPTRNHAPKIVPKVKIEPEETTTQTSTKPHKTGTKRQNKTKDSSGASSKRRKVKSNTSQNRTKATKKKPIFTCDECLDNWGRYVVLQFKSDPKDSGVPDPKETIHVFSTFKDYRAHLSDDHHIPVEAIDKEYSNPKNSFPCKICDCRFRLQHDLDGTLSSHSKCVL